MRLSFFLSASLAGIYISSVHATITEDLHAFLTAHKGQKGVSSTNADFLDWKSNVFTTNSTPAPIIPKAYIIQLKPGSNLLKRGQDEHSQFHKRAESIDYSTRQEFKNPDLFFGLSIQVKDDANETTLQEIPNVVNVWPVRVIPRPVTAGQSTTSALKAAAGNLTATAGSKANVNSAHRQTEVDRLHESGIKGTGTLSCQ